MMDKQEFLAEITSLLAREPGCLTGRETLNDLDGWDSLAVVSFMGFADEHFGVALSPKDIGASENIDDLFSLVAGRAAAS
jgi:acyl carrier protein